MRDGATYDIACLEPFSLAPGERSIVRTGVAVELPEGMVGLVLPRSRLAFEHGVTVVNGPGLAYANVLWLCQTAQQIGLGLTFLSIDQLSFRDLAGRLDREENASSTAG